MKRLLVALCLLSYTPFFYSQNTKDISGYETIQDQNTLKVLTPSLSKREISKIRLDNGLEAYLISDPGADESAAALAVNVGSWSDPKEFPGMAHFLEHMLFMGTKTYPDENAFIQFITDHGGSNNAFTALDRTVYSFSVNNDAFAQALDLFSHFFIDPLFKASEVGRELHAVDQEHSKNIQSDSRRAWMIFKETGNQNHPNRAFATGNADTLGHIPREALVDWYSQYYSASLMHLVIYSNLPMEKLKELAVKDFSSVKEIKSVPSIAYAPLSSEMQEGHFIYIKPVKDIKILTLDWELPKEMALDLDTHSADLIAYAIQNGGENSLIEQLKREKLAESLSVSAAKYTTDHLLMDVRIVLTREGVRKRDTVIERCFQTLAMLKKGGIPVSLFNEMETMATINYEYQSREKAFDFVTDTSTNLIDESISTYPQKTLIACQYNPKAIQAILTLLTPQNCIYTIMASPELTGVAPDKKEEWNGGEYTIRAIPDATLKKWMAATPNPHITLPPANPYIPKDLHLIHLGQTSSDAPTPQLISHDEQGKNYLWEDTRYETPEVFYVLGFKTPLFDGLAKSSAMTDLLTKTFYQKASPILSLGNAAGLYASLEQKNLKFSLKLYGYSEKAPVFLKNLLATLKDLSCSEEEFNLYKDSLVSLYENQSKVEPYLQAGEFISNILYNDAPLSSQKALSLKACTYEDFLTFLSKFFSECYLEGLYTGNLNKQGADALIQGIDHCLNYASYPLAEQLQKEVLILPKQQGPYAVTEKIKTLGNALILAIEQGSFSFDKKASQMILGTVLSDSFYNTLRTQQQTGYIVASWPREVAQQLLQFFLVQSSTHEPQDLLARFELFLEGYVKDFSAQLSPERFEEIRKNCIESLKQLPPNLEDMTTYLYELAFEKKGNFLFTEELITAIKALTYETLKQDTFSFFSRKNTKRLALLVEGDMQEHFIYKPISAESLKKQGSYVSYH